MKWGNQNQSDSTLSSGQQTLRTLRIIREVSRLLGNGYQRLLLRFGLMGLIRLGIFGTVFYGAVLISRGNDTDFKVLSVALLVGWICLYFEPSFNWRTYNLSLRSRIRRSALHVVHSLPLELLEPMSRGDWLRRVVHDLNQIEVFLLDKFPRQLGSLVVGMAALIVASLGLGGWALAMTFLASFFFLAGWSLERSTRAQRKVETKMDEALEDTWLESLEGIRTVHVHQAEAYFQRRFDEGIQKQQHQNGRPGPHRLAAFAEPTLTLLVLALVLLLASTDLIAGTAKLYLLFVLPLSRSAWDSGRAMCGWADIQEDLGSFAERLRPDYAGSHWGIQNELGLISKTERLSLRDAFWETSEDWAGPLGWTVRRGELWIVTGPSDSGKSALLEVLAGLRTLTAGEVECGLIKIFAGDRVPVGLCSYVEQYPFIFQGTLRENLSFGSQTKLSDVMLWKTLERVGLTSWVQELGGLDSVFEPHGRELLKAEKYRIALCRILLLQRPFILLDEPFVHFDDKTISLLAEILEEEKKTKAIVVVSRFIPKEIAVDGIISVTDFETKRAQSWGEVVRVTHV